MTAEDAVCRRPGSTEARGILEQAPEFGTEDYWRHAVLFNDVTYAPTESHILFSDRLAIANWLWKQGWRRDVRSEDVTER